MTNTTDSPLPDEKPQRSNIDITGGRVLAACVVPAELTMLRQALPAAGWQI